MSYIILIVEDHSETREFMVLYLELSGYRIYEAVNGSEGVKAANFRHPDLILMDISMPIMDGFEAAHIIRTSGDGISKIPIIAVTAFDRGYNSAKFKADFNEVLTKPVDFDKLDSVIHKYLPGN